jgi:phosphatidylinositol alpha-1,6-mannosyltransferase
MRILYLATDAFGGRGGIASYTRDLAAAMATYPSVDEVVVIPRHVVDEPEPAPPGVRQERAASRGKFAWGRAVLRELRRNGRFDLILCGHINLLPLARFAAIRSGAKMTLVIYGIEAWQRPGVVTRSLVKTVDATITISRFTLDRFARWHPAHGAEFTLPPAIDAAGLRGVRDQGMAERYGLRGRRVIMTMGRLHAAERSKGFDQILETLPSLPADIMYVVAGDGSDRERLEAKAAALGVADRVRFTGYVSSAQKAAHFALADAYVMPSTGEGFGIVFLEALAAGLPVVGSATDGGREALLDGKLGTLVDPAQSAALRAAILHALGKPRRVPAELEQFSMEQFQRRCHTMMDTITRR